MTQVQNINYEKSIFVLIKPPSKVISKHECKNLKEHNELREKADEQNLVIYYTEIIIDDGKRVAKQPWILDEKTLKPMTPIVEKDKPEKIQKPEKESGLQKSEPQKSEPIYNFDPLKCPYCKQKFTSTPGRTLHVKSKHPEKLEEYHQWVKKIGKN